MSNKMGVPPFLFFPSYKTSDDASDEDIVEDIDDDDDYEDVDVVFSNLKTPSFNSRSKVALDFVT